MRIACERDAKKKVAKNGIFRSWCLGGEHVRMVLAVGMVISMLIGHHLGVSPPAAPLPCGGCKGGGGSWGFVPRVCAVVQSRVRSTTGGLGGGDPVSLTPGEEEPLGSGLDAAPGFLRMPKTLLFGWQKLQDRSTPPHRAVFNRCHLAARK